MHKIIFLEYKFRDFSDKELIISTANGVMCAFEKLSEERIQQIKNLGLRFGVSFVVLPGRDTCPLSPESRDFAFSQLDGVTTLKPDIVWFDYLKFPGKWKILDKTSDYVIHSDCKYCAGVDRQKAITEFAQRLISRVPSEIKKGIFTMPLIMGDYGGWEKILGQNLKDLGNMFDFVSPMLYHRMIKKPVSYIHEHVMYLSKLTIKAEVIPIIQLKDMPDDLKDELSIGEFELAVKAATQPPSSGIAVFSWDQAIEKNKLESASNVLSKIK